MNLKHRDSYYQYWYVFISFMEVLKSLRKEVHFDQFPYLEKKDKWCTAEKCTGFHEIVNLILRGGEPHVLWAGDGCPRLGAKTMLMTANFNLVFAVFNFEACFPWARHLLNQHIGKHLLSLFKKKFKGPTLLSQRLFLLSIPLSGCFG